MDVAAFAGRSVKSVTGKQNEEVIKSLMLVVLISVYVNVVSVARYPPSPYLPYCGATTLPGIASPAGITHVFMYSSA